MKGKNKEKEKKNNYYLEILRKGKYSIIMAGEFKRGIEN